MQKLTIDDVLNAAGGTLVCGGKDAVFESITTDSRKAGDKALFIPLEGQKFDGHEFIEAAFDLGAAVALTHKDTEPMLGKTIIRVKDTFKALGDIAKFYMEKYRIPSAAVTGSVGKTTTKDMIYSALRTQLNAHRTAKNYNNEIGLPWTIFGIEKEHQAVVLEMGMNHFGEIARLADIARPDTAVITNIGMSHIENLGSREGIFRAKMEITEYFDENNLLIVNGDDDMLSKINGRYRVIRYGINDRVNNVYAKDIVNKGINGVEFTAVADGEEYRVEVPVAGTHNVCNALAAICVGREFGVPMDKLLSGIKTPELTPMRMEIINRNGITIINDCYNASPDSVKAALRVLSNTENKRRVAVLGDVLEMGDFAKKAHYEMGRTAASCGIDVLVTVGANAEAAALGASDAGMKNIISFAKTLEASESIGRIVKEGDAVLVKASRGMHFEDIVKNISF